MQITVEGHARPVPVEASDTLLTALLRAGLPFPFSCQTGNCGTCKCQVLSGEVEALAYSEHALGAAERARGIVLACRTQARTNVVLRRIDG
ncbi:MAG TPA: 2Fe-2S iron-sulfur cluster-binding protein [Burkholderiales bacterium]|nr:2Fe-2S iron-sulfur cluster-binding protein [Burkholderiales bacterium]